VNKTHLQARQKANTDLGIYILNRMEEMVAKGYTKRQAEDTYRHKIDQWEQEQEALDFAQGRQKAMTTKSYNQLRDGGDSGNGQPLDVSAKAMGRKLGREACPLAFREADLKAVHKAMQNGQNIRIKAFSTVDPLLPAELFPAIIARIHEHRLLDRLPVISMSAPSMEFLVHQSSTGTPAITAEGALKPDITLNFVSSTVTAQKIAATFGLSWETTLDFPAVIGYAQGEVFKEVIDVENAALINGSSGIVGFQQTSGIQTLAYSTGNYLDTFSLGIESLRTGSALAVCDLIVINPGTFGAVRRQHDAQGRYILNPDPELDQANQIWGVECLQTTAISAGTALLLDTQKFGFVPMRQNLEIQTGYTNDDFQRNISRWAVEERLNLAVERPSAVLNITGLPTS
jgi:HK97 family phage major capsid protein